MRRLMTLASVVLLPQYFTAWARGTRAVVGFSLINWVIFVALLITLFYEFGSLALRRQANRSILRGVPLLLPLLIPYVLSHIYGFARVDDIPVELAYDENGFSNLHAWYWAHLGMSLLASVGLAWTIAGALEKGLELRHLMMAATLPLWPVVGHAIVATLTSGLSLSELTSEVNRHVLQVETNFGLHGNAFGQYALFAYICVLGALGGNWSPFSRWWLVLTAAVVSAGILISFSRTALATWLLVTLFWHSGEKGARKWIAPVVTISLLSLMPAEMFQRVWKGISEGDLDLILSGRLEHMWVPALSDVWDSPIYGQGWGAYMWSNSVHMGLAFRTATVHNAYIRLLLEAGIVGLLLVCAFYSSAWKQAQIIARSEPDRLRRSMLKAWQWLIVAMLLTGITGDAITPEMIQIYFWIGFGIFLAVKADHRKRVDNFGMSTVTTAEC